MPLAQTKAEWNRRPFRFRLGSERTLPILQPSFSITNGRNRVKLIESDSNTRILQERYAYYDVLLAERLFAKRQRSGI